MLAFTSVDENTGLKTGVEYDMFWSKIGFGEPGGTIPRKKINASLHNVLLAVSETGSVTKHSKMATD